MLEKANLINIEDIIDKSVDELASIEGMDHEKARNLVKILSENVEIVEEEVVQEEEGVAVEESEDEEVEYYQCPNCGAKITEDMDRCPSCGIELEFKEEDDIEEESEDSKEDDSKENEEN